MTTNTKSPKEQAPPPAPIVPTEDPAAYEDSRFWSEPPWGDTYWCDMCSTCMRWRHSQRAGGRVCVTSFNFNFPMVIIEQGRCNEYRPVPGAEGLWTDDYGEEEDEYAEGGRRREVDGAPYGDEQDSRRPAPAGARRRTRRRQRRGPGGPTGGTVGGGAV